MEGTKCWTMLDAASAYWSVELEEKDQEKTAFSIPHVEFELQAIGRGVPPQSSDFSRYGHAM